MGILFTCCTYRLSLAYFCTTFVFRSLLNFHNEVQLHLPRPRGPGFCQRFHLHLQCDRHPIRGHQQCRPVCSRTIWPRVNTTMPSTRRLIRSATTSLSRVSLENTFLQPRPQPTSTRVPKERQDHLELPFQTQSAMKNTATSQDA